MRSQPVHKGKPFEVALKIGWCLRVAMSSKAGVTQRLSLSFGQPHMQLSTWAIWKCSVSPTPVMAGGGQASLGLRGLYGGRAANGVRSGIYATLTVVRSIWLQHQ